MEQAKRVRVGLLGCGAVGRLHAKRLARDERVELAFLNDPRREAAERLRDELSPGAVIGDDDCGAMLDRCGVDAVVICSPTTLHFAQATAALERGVDVLCEKPLAPERGQILALAALARRLKRVLSVSYQRRYMAAYRTARRELTERSEWYGPLREVHLFVCERWQQTIQGTWRDDPALGAGYFGDAGSHQIDMVHFVTGQTARRVHAESDRRGSRVEIVTRALAELTGGARLVAHFVGDANHWREEITFHCRDADLLLRSEKFFAPHLFRAKENVLEEVFDFVPDSDPDRAFVDGVISREGTLSPAECALGTHDWTAAVLDSVTRGRWVEVGREG
jgi:predicted dehydrogenase